MNEYCEILEHRVRQFTWYLRLMRARQRRMSRGNSFIIFEEKLRDTPGDGNVLVESKAKVLQAGTWHDSADDGIRGGADAAGADVPDTYWRDDDSSCRFIQFIFNPRYFDVDIPNTTLYRPEAEKILLRRLGFFYVKDRPAFTHPKENVVRFNPVRKAYLYGDERIASEDMAFVWFQVWRFPVDWRFFVTAAAFHESTNWEREWPLDARAPIGRQGDRPARKHV